MNPTRHVTKVVGDSLPSDIIVHSVSSNWEQGAIELLVLHESFSPTEKGAAIKLIPGECELKLVDTVTTKMIDVLQELLDFSAPSQHFRHAKRAKQARDNAINLFNELSPNE